MLELVRLVQNHHDAGHHHASPVERHHHDPGAGDVVYIDDDASGAGAGKDASAKRGAPSLDAPTINPLALVPPPADLLASPEPPSAFRSHISGPLERPPR